jgi:hypothetical protein
MAQLENKNIQPALALVGNLFVLGILGYILIGQSNKALWVFLVGLIGSALCCVPGWIVLILGLIDVYSVAEAVQRGEAVDENEYKNEMLYNICKIFDKQAIFKG